MFWIKLIIRCWILLFTLAPVFSIWKPKKPGGESVCKTPECHKRGIQYISHINPKIHPCDDFYGFACGNWEKYNNVPRYAASWNMANVLTHQKREVLANLLKNPLHTKNKNFIQLKEIYTACSQIPSYPRTTAQKISEKIITNGRYPDVPVWELHNKYLKLTGESAFFDSSVLAHKLPDGAPLLVLFEPSSAYGAIIHEPDWKPTEEISYRNFLYLLMRSLNLSDSVELLIERIKKVIRFRKRFHQIILRYQKASEYRIGPLEINDFHETLWRDVRSDSQKILWADICRILLHSVSDNIVLKRKVADVRQRNYFTELVDFLGDTPEEIIASHIEIHFVERHLRFSKAMFKLLETTTIEPTSLTAYIRIDDPERWETCLSSFNVQSILSQLYKQKYFRWSDKTIVHNILAKVKAEIKKSIGKVSWIDKDTRNLIYNKFDTVEEWIGFPPWFDNSSFPKPPNAHEMELNIPNASFDIVQNKIYIRAALMAPPIFDSEMPWLYNFAGMGSAIGHELHHIIQDCGAYKPNAVSSQLKIWWPDTVRNTCLIRKQCYITKYDELTKEEFEKRFGIKDAIVDTSVSFTENFPDAMGLQAAYKAYKEVVKKQPMICRTLPLFETYTCDHMFFIAYANAFCEYNSVKDAMNKLRSEKHSVGCVRVNGAVSNYHEFSTAFNCPLNTKMNPTNKCNIWK